MRGFQWNISPGRDAVPADPVREPSRFQRNHGTVSGPRLDLEVSVAVLGLVSDLRFLAALIKPRRATSFQLLYL